MAAVVEAWKSLLVVSGAPLVTGFAADAVAGAELGAAVAAETIVGDKMRAGIHG